jgi:hypothetical protein
MVSSYAGSLTPVEAHSRRLSLELEGLGRAELVEALVDLGIDPADEERGDRGQVGQVVPGGPGALHAVEEGVHHLAVALQREDQRDVDADAFGETLRDRGDARRGRGNLDEEVRPVDEPPQLTGLGDRALGLVRQSGVHLDRHPSVDAVGRVVDRAEHVAGPADVRRGDHAHGLFDVDTAHPQIAQLTVVELAAADRLLEDRRVGRRPDDVLVPDEVGQVSGGQASSAHVVEPDRHALLGELAQGVGHGTSPLVVEVSCRSCCR